MARKIPAVISCSSIVLLEHELSEVRAGLELTETEDSWDKILNAVLRLTALTVGCAADYPTQIIAACKSLARPIINSVNSERSRLSGCATDLLATLATQLRRTFETLIPLFVPTLLSLASRSNKIFIARAKACLGTIVENCQSPVIIPLLRHTVSDKSANLRLTAIDLIVACLNCFNPPDLETPNRVEDIESVIRATARDASADVRKSSRKAFEAYKALFPSRLDAFVAPLTPTMRKYLDIKSAPANQRKFLLLSSSTSAPSLPSSAQPPDILSRSQPLVQRHVKSASASSTILTRVEKASKRTKPENKATVAYSENASMPPPAPPQHKSSSGPVRPPPSMRQAVAAAAAAPSRPLLSRHALQSSATNVLDMTRSQPNPHGGAQRPTKTPTPPIPSPELDIAQSVPGPQPADPPVKERTNRPHRVLKQEPVPVPSVAQPTGPPPPVHKQVDNLRDSVKERNRDKAALASSTSSTASEHAKLTSRSRPPSRLASSTSSNVGEEKKENEGELEHRKRPESRAGGEFRPRPASRAENESHKRAESKEREPYARPASRLAESHKRAESKDREPHARPASRTEGELHARPASRMDKKTQPKVEAKAETKASTRTTKNPTAEQPQAIHAPQPQPPAKQEEPRKRREERTEARAPSKRSKEEKSTREKPSKKRKGEVKEVQVVQQVSQEQLPAEKSNNQRKTTVFKAPSNKDKCHAPTPLELAEKQRDSEIQENAPMEMRHTKESQDVTSRMNDPAAALEEVQVAQPASVPSEPVPESKHEENLQEEGPEERTPTRPIKQNVGQVRQVTKHCVKPLAIHKAGRTPTSLDAECEEENADVVESEIHLPPSPPEDSYHPPEFVTPAPLRHAAASRKYQVPATPISKLLASIQRGFDLDSSVIGEETEDDITFSSVTPSAEEAADSAAREDDSDSLDFFVDVRPRKTKSGHGKEHGGRKDERVPFTPRAENH